MKKFYFLCVIFFFIHAEAYAQDATFLNSNQSLIFLNPSFAGSNGGIRLQTSYRNQWPDLSGNFKTYAASFDAYITRLRAGLAIDFMLDDHANGTLKTSVLGITYAQYFSAMDGRLKLVPSVRAAYCLRNLDVKDLHYGDMIDARRGVVWNTIAIPRSQVSYVDLSAGVRASYKSAFNAGGYVFHVNSPDDGHFGSSRLPYRALFHASYFTRLTVWTKLQVFYKHERQNNRNNNYIALNTITKDRFILGIGYANGYNTFLNMGFRTNYLSVQLSYGTQVYKDRLGAATWELHCSYNLRDKEKRKTFDGFESM